MHLFTPATWSWPQYAEVALLLIGQGVVMATHGQPYTGKKNAWYSLTATGILVAILYFGGFYAPR